MVPGISFFHCGESRNPGQSNRSAPLEPTVSIALTVTLSSFRGRMGEGTSLFGRPQGFSNNVTEITKKTAGKTGGLFLC